MAIGAPVRLGSATATSGTGTFTFAPTIESSPSDWLVLRVGWRSNTVTLTGVADTAGNTWTALVAGAGTTNARGAIWACKAQTRPLRPSDLVTLTFSTSQGRLALVLDGVPGLASASTPDKTASATGSSTAPSSGATATTAYANEMCLGLFVAAAGGDTLSAVGSGYTAETKAQSGASTSDVTAYPLYRIVSATGAQTASGTLSTSRTWDALIATVQEPQTAPDHKAGSVTAEIAYTTSQRGATFVGAEVAATGTQRGATFLGAEVAYSAVHTGISFVGAEVAYTPVAAPTVFNRVGPRILRLSRGGGYTSPESVIARGGALPGS